MCSPRSWPSRSTRWSSCRRRFSTTCRGACCHRSPGGRVGERLVSSWGHAERTLRQRRGTLRDGIDAGSSPGQASTSRSRGRTPGRWVRRPGRARWRGGDGVGVRRAAARAELVHIACHGSFRRDDPMFCRCTSPTAARHRRPRGPRAPSRRSRALTYSVANAKVVQLTRCSASPTPPPPEHRQHDRPTNTVTTHVGDGDRPPPPGAHRRRQL